MTFTKTGSEWPDDLANAGMSDAAYRTHHEAVTWIYKVEQMDLCIPKRLIRRFVGSYKYEEAICDLVAAGLWRDVGEHYLVVHHADVIRGGIVAQQKKRERDKMAQRSARRRAANRSTVSADSRADVSADPDSQTDRQLTDSIHAPDYEWSIPDPGEQCREFLGVDRWCSQAVAGEAGGRAFCAEHLSKKVGVVTP